MATPSTFLARFAVAQFRGLPNMLDYVAIDVVLICLSLRFRKRAEYYHRDRMVRGALELSFDV